MLSSNFKRFLLGSLVSATLFIGCGGGGSGGTTPLTTTTGTIVDPYIVGAVLCEDKNKNGTCETVSGEEQLSTPSNAAGIFTFSSPLTASSHIIIQTQGLHNGLTYDLNLSGVVDSGGKIEVVSPITTLETRGLSKSDIVSLLTTAGLTGLSTTDISSDPMYGLSGKMSVTDAELRKLQASLATYGLLKIMSGSDPLKDMNGSQLVNNDAIKLIASSMVNAIKNALNETTFNAIKNQIDTVRTNVGTAASNYIPSVTTDVIIKAAVTVMDRIVTAGNTKCNETDGNVTLALQEANNVAASVLAQVNTIGQYYYGLENKNLFNSIPSQYSSLITSLPNTIKSGIANDTGVLTLNEDNEFVTHKTTKLKNLWDYVELNGGNLGDNNITAHKLASSVSSLKITNEANQTTTYNFPNTTVDISVSSISDGKNKLSIILSNGDENYLYFYKGSYDANDDNQSLKGDTNYYFHDINASGVEANDMFVMVENFNDVNRNDDDRWIYMLPYDNNNSISVKNLKSTGGYRVTSIDYEQYIVSNTNANNAGQEITTTSGIDVRKFVSGKSITGTLKKLNENNESVPFSFSDLGTESIWLHAHYTHPTATYTAICKSGSSICDENRSGNVWVAAQDLHLTLADYQNQSGSYNLDNGTYTINNLYDNTGYKLLAFWKEKDILGLEYNVTTPTGNDIVLNGQTKDVNGTLINSDTQIRIVRKTTFSGQPYYSYSTITTKGSNNLFSINYHFDTPNTQSYLIYGNINSTLDFDSTCGALIPINCKSIKISNGSDDNSTNITIP